MQLKPLLDVAKLTRGQPAAQASFVLTFTALSGLYYLAWQMCRGLQSRAMWFALLASLFVINLSMLWLYPIDAADIFDNIARGRITAVYGGNPFYAVPQDFPRDVFRPYVAWQSATSAYGPGWELLAAGTSRLAGDDKLANVLGYKLLGLLFYGGCVVLIAGILQRRAPERSLQGVCLFAWNPLVIYETAGNGHNDIVLAFFILLAMYALVNRRFTWAALALTVGALVKFASILLLPIVLVAGLHMLATRQARWRFVTATLLVCMGLVVLGYAPFWRGGDPLSITRRETLFTASLPALIQAQLEKPLGTNVSQLLVARVALLLTGWAVVAQSWRTWRATDWLAPVRASAHILLFYLLFTCLWFQAWYVLWPLALAAVLPEGALGRTIVLLSYSAVWKTIIFDFFLYRGGPLPPRVWRETTLGLVTLGLVWLYRGYTLIAPRKPHPPSPISDPRPTILNSQPP